MSNVEKLRANNKIAEEILISLKCQLDAIKNEKVVRRIQELEHENSELRKNVESAKIELIRCEVANGKKQIPLPDAAAVVVKCESVAATQSQPGAGSEKKNDEKKQAKEKKPPKKKKGADKPASGDESTSLKPLIDVGRLDFRVGKVIHVRKHPDADNLSVEKIECGEPRPRTVVSGLVKYVPIDEMKDRMVVIFCNIKPTKLRGVMSEAIVMCAFTPEKVEILTPPAGAVPGDLVHCDGYIRNPDAQLNPKKKIFETCAPDLLTNDSFEACYKGMPWNVPGKGVVKVQTLKNVPVK